MPEPAFHHLGLAARSPSHAARFLASMGYAVGEAVRDPEQNVHLALATHPAMPTVEVVTPTETEGPLEAVLRASAELAYHVCFEVDGADAQVAAWRAARCRVACVSPPKPAVLFGGRRVSFWTVGGFGLVELLER